PVVTVRAGSAQASVAGAVAAPADPTSLPGGAAGNPAAALLGVAVTSSAPLVDGGDGRIYFPGDQPGIARLKALAPDGLIPTFSTKGATGWSVLDSAGGTSGAALEASFAPNADALLVVVEFRDETGGPVATIGRTLHVGP